MWSAVWRRCMSSCARRYSPQHEWLSVVDERAGVARVGVSAYAAEALGEVVFAELPEPRRRLRAGDECGALESVKAASELYSPAAGVVVRANADVVATPSLVNSSCLDRGWLFEMRLDDPRQLDQLMTEEAYADFLKEGAKER